VLSFRRSGSNFSLQQFIQDPNKTLERTPQAVELPDHKHITRAHVVPHLGLRLTAIVLNDNVYNSKQAEVGIPQRSGTDAAYVACISDNSNVYSSLGMQIKEQEVV
jgi:hypothetical protein